MGKGFEFICPTCLMADKSKKELNSMEDIAFSMPNSVFQKLRAALEKDHSELAKEIGDMGEPNRIRCITWQDIEDCLREQPCRGKVQAGTYTVSGAWLKTQAKRFGLTEDLVNAVPDDMVLLEEWLEFVHTLVDGCKFPLEIRNKKKGRLSNERRCAKCGRLLSADTGKAPELRILLQGSSRAGKTSCMIAIFNKLLEQNLMFEEGFRAELANGTGSGAECVNENHDWIRKEREYYIRSIKVEKTDTDRNEPVAYSLLVKIDNRAFVLTFVDMPGEFFDNAGAEQNDSDDLLNLYLPIYDKCHVVWTCLRYETVVSRELTQEQLEMLDKATGLTKDLVACTEYEKYRHRFLELIEAFGSYDCEIPPHAVILTATDGIVSVYAPEEDELQQMRDNHIIPNPTEQEPKLVQTEENDHRLVLQEHDCFLLCNRVVSYIKARNETICKLFHQFSERTKYFALAAYGHPASPRPSENEDPADMGKGVPPAPFQVEFPLYWSMAIAGFLPIKYKVRYERKWGLVEGLFKGKRGRELVKTEDEIITSFEKAGPQTRENLLQDKGEYARHCVLLKKGVKK